MRSVTTPLIDTVDVMPYAAIGAVHADPVDPMPTRESSGLLREPTAEAGDALLAVAGPGSNSPQVIVELRLLGGALARPAEHASAFCHRQAAFSLLTIGVLPNFSPSADPAENARSYDEETLTWLAALADQNDPAGVLRVGQVVRR